jgi:hypothetical protein
MSEFIQGLQLSEIFYQMWRKTASFQGADISHPSSHSETEYNKKY